MIPAAPVSCLPCWITKATKGGAELNGPVGVLATGPVRGAATGSVPLPAPAAIVAVATLKTACDVVPEWACTIATRARPRSPAPTT